MLVVFRVAFVQLLTCLPLCLKSVCLHVSAWVFTYVHNVWNFTSDAVTASVSHWFRQFNSYHTRELTLHLGKEQNSSHSDRREDALSFSLSFSSLLAFSSSVNIYQIIFSFTFWIPFSLCSHTFSNLSLYVLELYLLLYFISRSHSLIYTVHAQLSSSFSSSLGLVGLFYWCPSYELSWARDVNYRTMIGPLLHYAWKCPTGEKMAYSQERWMEGWRDE